MVFDLEVGEDLKEEGDNRVRGTIASHPTQSAGVVSVNVDVGEVAGGASDEGGDKGEGDDGGREFPDVDVGVRRDG